MDLKNILINLDFKNIISCSNSEVEKIRLIRNEKKIRIMMRTEGIISFLDHKLWLSNLKFSKINFFYCIFYKNEIIGGLSFKNYNQDRFSGEWGFYISGKKNFTGLGFVLEFKALEFIFDKFNIKELYCYVLKHNVGVIKLHKKFKFVNVKFEEYVKINHFERKLHDATYLKISKKNLKEIKIEFNEKYFS